MICIDDNLEKIASKDVFTRPSTIHISVPKQFGTRRAFFVLPNPWVALPR